MEMLCVVLLKVLEVWFEELIVFLVYYFENMGLCLSGNGGVGEFLG